MFLPLIGIISLGLLAPLQVHSKEDFDYCMPSNSSCWPAPSEWDQLKGKLTGQKLHDLGDTAEYRVCEAPGDDAFEIEDGGEGRCMQYHDCSKKGCIGDAGWNIPAYSVEATSEDDIVNALEFATKHNLQVVVKTSGHNYAGSSMGEGALLIWMRNFQKFGQITEDLEKCGTTYAGVIKVGGGQVWDEIYKAAGTDWHIVGGGGLSVSAAGGWLMGGGLSASARLYGMGIDNVVEFEVILADGTKKAASKCENEDLFWALRGGGGGSFGVTTAVYYQLHAAKPVCEVYFDTTDFFDPTWDVKTVYKWIDLLVDTAPTLSAKWGGYWTLNSGIFYFEGSEAELDADEFMIAIKNLVHIRMVVKCKDSYFEVRGGPDDMVTDKTGSNTFYIASRLIPVDFVQGKPKEMKDILKWMVSNGFYTFNYIIGGKMMEPATDETAVNPAMRKSIFQIEVFTQNMIEKLRKDIPDSGAGFNHAAKDEPDWENQAWGENKEKLQVLKEKYDPDNRFNCYHCIGYVAPPSASLTSSLSLILASMILLRNFV